LLKSLGTSAIRAGDNTFKVLCRGVKSEMPVSPWDVGIGSSLDPARMFGIGGSTGMCAELW